MGDKPLGEKRDMYSQSLLQSRIYSNFITIPQTTIDYTLLHQDLTQLKHVTYVLSKMEQNNNIQILIKFSQQVRLTTIHKVIMQQSGAIEGLIKYQKPDKISETMNYVKQQSDPYLEYGNTPQVVGRPLKHSNIIKLAEEGDVAGAIELVKAEMTKDYLIHKDTIEANLEKIAKPSKKKYDVPTYNVNEVTLTPQQQKVWDEIQKQPKARKIIWVTGQYGSGKTFLSNFITNNHEYDVYNAGQSASFDNVVYGYNEEGVIMWDLPRTFDFNQYGDSIANVVEKFSDFGQVLTSRKYAGKKVIARGHVIVFSNHEPIDMLKHRDIVHIDLGGEGNETINGDNLIINPKSSIIENGDRYLFDSTNFDELTTDESDNEEYIPIRPLKPRSYNSTGTSYL